MNHSRRVVMGEQGDVKLSITTAGRSMDGGSALSLLCRSTVDLNSPDAVPEWQQSKIICVRVSGGSHETTGCWHIQLGGRLEVDYRRGSVSRAVTDVMRISMHTG